MARMFACALWGALVLGLATTGAVAQETMPKVRDSRTGTVWSPDLAAGVDAMGQPTSPNAYVNRAFDPGSQHARVDGVVVEHPKANLMGTVPITAGPDVPVVSIDVPSLQALPGRYWLSILYLTNNSGTTVDALVACRFLNDDREVENVRVVVPPAGPGERLGMPVRGPRTELFVNRVRCSIVPPA
jgi:hypothetical protein